VSITLKRTPAAPATAEGVPSAAAPIFDTLVGERGDVLAEAREAARAAREQATEALDWSDLHTEAENDG
jgi:hypothetical protein